MPLTYPSYLKLPELLSLQQPRSSPPEHDETLFIVIHQVYELWFKLLLHEGDKVVGDFDRDDLWGAVATFQRMRTVMKTLVGQLDILETMTPLRFASFRSRLETASGFQSTQFRELEFFLGYKRAQFSTPVPQEDPGHAAIARRYEAPSLVDQFYRFLSRRGLEVPSALLERDVRLPVEANETLQDAILEVYQSQPDLVILFELMMDFDEGLMEWRYRHVKLVERTIGAKHGSGGSAGVEFLKATLFKPLFEDLWKVRYRM